MGIRGVAVLEYASSVEGNQPNPTINFVDVHAYDIISGENYDIWVFQILYFQHFSLLFQSHTLHYFYVKKCAFCYSYVVKWNKRYGCLVHKFRDKKNINSCSLNWCLSKFTWKSCSTHDCYTWRKFTYSSNSEIFFCSTEGYCRCRYRCLLVDIQVDSLLCKEITNSK